MLWISDLSSLAVLIDFTSSQLSRLYLVSRNLHYGEKGMIHFSLHFIGACRSVLLAADHYFNKGCLTLTGSIYSTISASSRYHFHRSHFSDYLHFAKVLLPNFWPLTCGVLESSTTTASEYSELVCDTFEGSLDVNHVQSSCSLFCYQWVVFLSVEPRPAILSVMLRNMILCN